LALLPDIEKDICNGLKVVDLTSFCSNTFHIHLCSQAQCLWSFLAVSLSGITVPWEPLNYLYSLLRTMKYGPNQSQRSRTSASPNSGNMSLGNGTLKHFI